MRLLGTHAAWSEKNTPFATFSRDASPVALPPVKERGIVMSVSLCGPVDIRVYLPVYELVSESHVQTLPKYASVGHERGLCGH